MTGSSTLPDWRGSGPPSVMDFFHLKGVLDGLFEALHLEGISYTPGEHPSFHPGKCAEVLWQGTRLGWLGELHPLVSHAYDLEAHPVLAADLDIEAILPSIPERFSIAAVPAYPPVLEDLALVVDEDVPAARVEAAIRKWGGNLVVGVRLFDVYQGGQIGSGKRSLAYSVVYQSPEKTLTDDEVSQVRKNVVEGLESELGAVLRS